MNEKAKKYLITDISLTFLALGIFHLIPGTELPLIRSDYGLTYQFGGFMLSAQSVGVLAGGLLAGIPAKLIGAKKTYLIFEMAAISGLVLTVLTGHPAVLIISMICLGMSKGSTTYFGNQITNNLSEDASLTNLVNAFFAAGACIAPFIGILCGASWRKAYLITIAFCCAGFLHGLRTEIGPDAYRAIGETDQNELAEDGGHAGSAWGFLKSGQFWLCAVIMFTYMSLEASIIGWMVTYLMDYGQTSRGFAQMLVTVLWGVLLIGRFISTAASRRYQPHQMLAVMSAGTAVFFTLMMFGHSVGILTAGVLGLGLSMAGMYASCVAGTGSLMTKYPLCMGIMIALPGIGPIIMPSVIGSIADLVGIHAGMMYLYSMLAVMLAATALYVRYAGRLKGE